VPRWRGRLERRRIIPWVVQIITPRSITRIHSITPVITSITFLSVFLLLSSLVLSLTTPIAEAEGASNETRIEIEFNAGKEVYTMDTLEVRGVLFFNNSSFDPEQNKTVWNRTSIGEDVKIEIEWSFDDDKNHTTFERIIYVYYREPGEHWVGAVARWGYNNATITSEYYRHYITALVYKEKGWKVAIALFIVAARLSTSIGIMVASYIREEKQHKEGDTKHNKEEGFKENGFKEEGVEEEVRKDKREQR